MEEIWKKIVEFGGYEISNLGCLKSYRGPAKDKSKFRFLKGRNYEGYTVHALYDENGVGYTRRNSVLVLQTFVGPRPMGMQAAHLNGIRNDDRLDNLIWATVKENAGHRMMHGTSYMGVAHHSAKLSPLDVRFIRKTHAAGIHTMAELAAMHGMNQNNIKKVINRTTWKHVE